MYIIDLDIITFVANVDGKMASVQDSRYSTQSVSYFAFDIFSSSSLHVLRQHIKSISILGRVILGTYDQTKTFPRTSVHHLNNVYHFLLITKGPINFVVVSSAQVDHYVLIPVEEHGGTVVVQLVHLIKILDLVNVHHVNNGKVLHLLGNLSKNLILDHAGWVGITPEPNHHHPVFLRYDGLVHLPAVIQMWKKVRHVEFVCVVFDDESPHDKLAIALSLSLSLSLSL